MAGAHAHPNYVKIWVLLFVLLVVSIVGPELDPLADFTDCFRNCAREDLLCRCLLHASQHEKKYVWFLLLISTVLLGVFFFGVAGDVMKADGQTGKTVSLTIPVRSNKGISMVNLGKS